VVACSCRDDVRAIDRTIVIEIGIENLALDLCADDAHAELLLQYVRRILHRFPMPTSWILALLQLLSRHRFAQNHRHSHSVIVATHRVLSVPRGYPMLIVVTDAASQHRCSPMWCRRHRNIVQATSMHLLSYAGNATLVTCLLVAYFFVACFFVALVASCELCATNWHRSERTTRAAVSLLASRNTIRVARHRTPVSMVCSVFGSLVCSVVVWVVVWVVVCSVVVCSVVVCSVVVWVVVCIVARNYLDQMKYVGGGVVCVEFFVGGELPMHWVVVHVHCTDDRAIHRIAVANVDVAVVGVRVHCTDDRAIHRIAVANVDVAVVGVRVHRTENLGIHRIAAANVDVDAVVVRNKCCTHLVAADLVHAGQQTQVYVAQLVDNHAAVGTVDTAVAVSTHLAAAGMTGGTLDAFRVAVASTPGVLAIHVADIHYHHVQDTGET